MDRHIVLIGFMGAGKTTVGGQLSATLGCPLLDTDAMIEEQAGMTISEIFANQGEEAFRRTETEVLADLACREPAVVSTGGGVPLREENRRALRDMGYVVYLKVRPDTVLRRLSGDTTRPLLQGENKREKVESLLAGRDPVYRAAAHLAVEADGRKPEDIAAEILSRIQPAEP